MHHFGHVKFPDPLVYALEEGRLVFFVGAGVSQGPPAGLPSFHALAESVTNGCVPAGREDEYLGRYADNHRFVHDDAASVIADSDSNPNQLHKDLVHLSSNCGELRIVTTNYDRLLEEAIQSSDLDMPSLFHAPALPLGDDFNGIVHLHGSVDQDPRKLVLTDRDFGRAYLSKGWAREFLLQLFAAHPVLFVGYSHRDPVLNYLSRGLYPEANADRYALVEQPDAQELGRWEALGISPISYENPDGSHEELYEAVAGWRNQQQRGALDRRKKVHDLLREDDHESKSLERIDDPQAMPSRHESFLERIVRSDADVDYFLEAANAEIWVQWLVKHGEVEAIFRDEQLDEREKEIAEWLGKEVAVQAPMELLSILRERGSLVPGNLLDHLVLGLTGVDDGETLRLWVPFVASSLEPGQCPAGVWRVLRLLVEFELPEEYSLLFNTLTEPFPSTTVRRERREANSPERTQPELSVASDYRAFDGTSSALLEFGPGLAQQLLPGIASNLRKMDSLTQDSPTHHIHRRTISESDQNRLRDGTDELIDAARESFELLLRERPDRASDFIGVFLGYSSPILNRIGIFALDKHTNIPADEKIDNILEQGWLYDSARWHEVLVLLRGAAPGASSETRKRLLKEIRAYEEDEDNDHDLYHQYRVVKFIDDATPGWAELEDLHDKLESHFSDIGAPKHPSFLSYVGDATVVDDKLSLSSEEIRERSVSKTLDLLLEADDSAGLGRLTRYESFAEVAREDPRKALSLIDEASSRGFNDPRFLQALTKGTLESQQGPELQAPLLDRLWEACREIDNLRPLAEFLRDAMSDHLLSEAVWPTWNAFADELWRSWNPEVATTSQYYQRATNSVSGLLLEYWLIELQLLTNDDASSSTVEVHEILRRFTGYLSESAAQFHSSAVLFRWMPFLHSVAPDWVDDELFGTLRESFSGERTPRHAAWDGMAYWQAPSEELMSKLRPHFGFLWEESSALESHVTEIFVGRIANYAILFADEPYEDWVRPLFKHSGGDVREKFFDYVSSTLEGLNEDECLFAWEEWLGDLIAKRRRGQPVDWNDPAERSAIINIGLRVPSLFAELTDEISTWANGEAETVSVTDLRLGQGFLEDVLPSQEGAVVGRFFSHLSHLLPKSVEQPQFAGIQLVDSMRIAVERHEIVGDSMMNAAARIADLPWTSGATDVSELISKKRAGS